MAVNSKTTINNNFGDRAESSNRRFDSRKGILREVLTVFSVKLCTGTKVAVVYFSSGRGHRHTVRVYY